MQTRSTLSLAILSLIGSSIGSSLLGVTAKAATAAPAAQGVAENPDSQEIQTSQAKPAPQMGGLPFFSPMIDPFVEAGQDVVSGPYPVVPSSDDETRRELSDDTQ